MTQLPNLGQESVHETFRIIIPGYFALFAVYTLYPEPFNGESGIALALIGGVGLGIFLYGMNLQNWLPLFNPLRKMLKTYESEKTQTMKKIWNQFNENSPSKVNTKELDTDKFYSDFWSNFSYSEVSESVRARQRIYASTFYLYANCCFVMIGYFVSVLIAISNPHITQFLSYNLNLQFNAARLVFSIAFAGFFWFKAKEELEHSMSFQKTAMYWHSKELCEKLSDVMKLHEKIMESGEKQK